MQYGSKFKGDTIICPHCHASYVLDGEFDNMTYMSYCPWCYGDVLEVLGIPPATTNPA